MCEEIKNEENEVCLGSPDTFYTKDSGNIFGISFDKLFGKPGLDAYNEFSLKSRRNFKNISEVILKTYSDLFLNEKEFIKNDECTECLFSILNANYKILIGPLGYEDFLRIIDKIINSGNKYILNTINNLVESGYQLELDKATEDTIAAKKRVNVELQFTDEHAKSLLKVSYLYRLMIPIVSQYFTYNKFTKTEIHLSTESDEVEQEELLFEEANANVFAYLFEKFVKDADALRNKLYKLVYSRVTRTAYSDKRFWDAARNVAITKDSVTLEIYKKLLTNAIPKLSVECDKNIISFFQSIVNNQIDFLFQNKFKYRYQSVGGNNYAKYSDDDDSVSEYEKLEILMLRKDEGLHRIRKLNIHKVLQELPEKIGIEVSDTEIQFLSKNLERHQVQERILTMFAMKYFRDNRLLSLLSYYEYCKLLLLCKKYLEKHKFILLPMILTAHCERHRERTSISGKKVRPLIENSKKYDELFETKYKNFPTEIEKMISSIIGTTYSSIFKDKNGNELFDSSVKVARIAEEIIDLAYLA